MSKLSTAASSCEEKRNSNRDRFLVYLSFVLLFPLMHVSAERRGGGRERERNLSLARRLQLCGRSRSGSSRFDEGGREGKVTLLLEVARAVLNISPALSLFIGTLITSSFYNASAGKSLLSYDMRVVYIFKETRDLVALFPSPAY